MVTRITIISLALLVTASHGFQAPMTGISHGKQQPYSRTELRAFAADEALSAVNHFFQTEPYLSAFLTCSVKASAADWVAQSQAPVEERNVNRNLAFVAYGGLYQGCIQSFIFGVLFPALFPGDATTQSIMTQVALDIFFLGPFVAMPTVYSIKALFAGEEQFVSAGITKYMDQIQTKGILFKYWAIWGPVQTINFWLVPPHLRVFFVALVSFFWICLLSTVSSSSSSSQASMDNSSSSSNNNSLLLPKAMPVPIPILSYNYEAQVQQQSSMFLKPRGNQDSDQPQWARSASSI